MSAQLEIEQLALVVRLACLTEDRAKDEQRALLATAHRVDAQWNRQTGSNPLLRGQPLVDCTYSDNHAKGCKCQPPPGTTRPMRVREPRGGWSYLEALAAETWCHEPREDARLRG